MTSRFGPPSSVLLFWLLGAASLLGGCSEETIAVTDVKPISEPIASEEWTIFRRIVDELPERNLTDFPSVFPPLPRWLDARTLPVNELAVEEGRTVEAGWSVTELAPRLSRKKDLLRLLKRERMTVEQFAGITVAVGAAMLRSQLDEDHNFDDLLRQGQDVINRMKRDQQVFSQLGLDARHQVLDHAAWIHRVDRAQRMSQIPGENVALVREHRDWLAGVMSKQFQRHPFADIVDRLEEFGVPFVELPDVGSDDRLEWDPATAIIGRDPAAVSVTGR